MREEKTKTLCATSDWGHWGDVIQRLHGWGATSRRRDASLSAAPLQIYQQTNRIKGKRNGRAVHIQTFPTAQRSAHGAWSYGSVPNTQGLKSSKHHSDQQLLSRRGSHLWDTETCKSAFVHSCVEHLGGFKWPALQEAQIRAENRLKIKQAFFFYWVNWVNKLLCQPAGSLTWFSKQVFFFFFQEGLASSSLNNCGRWCSSLSPAAERTLGWTDMVPVLLHQGLQKSVTGNMNHTSNMWNLARLAEAHSTSRIMTIRQKYNCNKKQLHYIDQHYFKYVRTTKNLLTSKHLKKKIH